MEILIRFRKDQKDMTIFPYTIGAPCDYRSALVAAYDQFLKENPVASLLDGVSIAFDKLTQA